MVRPPGFGPGLSAREAFGHQSPTDQLGRVQNVGAQPVREELGERRVLLRQAVSQHGDRQPQRAGIVQPIQTQQRGESPHRVVEILRNLHAVQNQNRELRLQMEREELTGIVHPDDAGE